MAEQVAPKALAIWTFQKESHEIFASGIKIADFQRCLDVAKVTEHKQFIAKEIAGQGPKTLPGIITLVTYFSPDFNDCEIIDGQHRYYALKQLYEFSNAYYSNIKVTFQVIKVANENDAKYWYNHINMGTKVEIPRDFMQVGRPKCLAKYFEEKFPKLFSTAPKPKIPRIRIIDLEVDFTQEFETVQHMSNDELIDRIFKYNKILNETDDSKFAVGGRDLGVIKRAREKAHEFSGSAQYAFMFGFCNKNNWGKINATIYEYDRQKEKEKEAPQIPEEKDIAILDDDHLWQVTFDGKYEGVCYKCNCKVLPKSGYKIFHRVKSIGPTFRNLKILCQACSNKYVGFENDLDLAK